jgi:hypothetical protein
MKNKIEDRVSPVAGRPKLFRDGDTPSLPKRRDESVGFSLTPGFSRVGGRGRKFNRFSGFSCIRKTVETVFVHPAF